MKISIIGGGNMGGAIAYGAIRQGVVTTNEVTISHLSEKMKPLFGEVAECVTLENNNVAAIKDAELIILAVKPWLVEEVIGEISTHIDRTRQSIISVVAGLSFDKLAQMLNFDQLGSTPLYRVIPNTAISIGEGVSILSVSGSTPQLDHEVVTLFEALGSVFVVDEELMTPLTSLSSCGIAFALRYLDASTRGGTEVGISPKMSLEVTIKTMEGALALLKHNASQPQAEIDKVTTKGGITLKGLEAMESGGFSQSVIGAIKSSR